MYLNALQYRERQLSIGRTFLNIIALEVGSKEVPMKAFDDLNQILRRNFVRSEGIACLIIQGTPFLLLFS